MAASKKKSVATPEPDPSPKPRRRTSLSGDKQYEKTREQLHEVGEENARLRRGLRLISERAEELAHERW